MQALLKIVVVLAAFRSGAPVSASRLNNGAARQEVVRHHNLPILLDAAQVAEVLRTSKKAVYALVERRQLPGVIRLGRRVLFREDALLDFLRQKSEPSLERLSARMTSTRSKIVCARNEFRQRSSHRAPL